MLIGSKAIKMFPGIEYIERPDNSSYLTKRKSHVHVKLSTSCRRAVCRFTPRDANIHNAKLDNWRTLLVVVM